MKIIISILTLAFAGVFSFAYASNDTLNVKTSAQCGSCKKRIENKLNFTKGIKNATVDLNTKVTTVIYDSEKIKPEEIKMAIAKVGYDADEVPADEKSYNKLPKCCQKGGHE